MRLEMYTVYDKAVRAYLPPFYVRGAGEAVRTFTSTVNESGHQFNKYAGDYTLYFLGVFDDSGGVFEAVDPQRVISALEVLVPENPFTEDVRQEALPLRKMDGRTPGSRL